jgi:thioredoxin-like negative regulator of GroEL
MNCLCLNRVPQEKFESAPRCGSCKTVLDVPRQPLRATAASFDRDVAYWPETLLIFFWSSWCLYCKIYEPLVTELIARKPGKLKVLKIDIETEAYLAQRFTVTKTPTFLVYKNGVFAVRMDGAPKDKSEFLNWIENLLTYTSY